MEMGLLWKPPCFRVSPTHSQIRPPNLQGWRLVNEFAVECAGTNSKFTAHIIILMYDGRQDLATREHMLDHGQPPSSIQASRQLMDETNNLTSTLLPTTPDGGSKAPPPRNDCPTSATNQYPSENAKEKVETDASQILGYHSARAGTSQSGSLPLQEDGHFVPEAHGVEEYTSLELKPIERPTTHLKSPSEPATQDPKISALQSPSALTSGQTQPILSEKIDSIINSPSILVDPKCSGYFVEPVRTQLFVLPSILNLMFFKKRR